MDFPIGSDEFSRGTARSRSGDSSGKPHSQPVLRMKIVELNFIVNTKVVGNCLRFLTILNAKIFGCYNKSYASFSGICSIVGALTRVQLKAHFDKVNDRISFCVNIEVVGNCSNSLTI